MGKPTMERRKDEQEMSAIQPVGRRSARAELEALIDRRYQETAKLRDLFDVLPSKLPPAADEALWMLIISARF